MDKGNADILRSDGGRGARMLGLNERTGTRGSAASVSGLDRWVANRVLSAAGIPQISIELWNGEIAAAAPEPLTHLRINERRALYGLLYRTDINFGDAFSDGRIEVEGDLIGFLEDLYLSVRRANRRGPWRQRLFKWVNRPNANSQATAQGNIHHHYDLGNDFYRLWLDERMLYTCAYYPHDSATLEEAQLAKMEHVCRKLELEPGMRVVEAGCGWGALALYMAQHYQVHVTAYNISTEQLAYARARAEAEGLSDLVDFVEADYRTMQGPCDRFVSVGMLEHVGQHNFRELGILVKRVLAEDGRGLIHSIGRNSPAPNNPWIEQRIFPGSYPPSLAEMSEIFEPHALSILDVENLRLHYARTCREWLERYDDQIDAVAEMYDTSFSRAWRLYLAGSVAAFTTGSLQLFQVVFSHEENNSVPLTREHLYR